MDEEEYQRLVNRTVGGMGAAGALAHTENLSAWEKIKDAAKSIQESDFWQGVSDPRTTVEERYYSDEGWHWLSEGELAAEWIKQNPEIAEKILMGGIGAAAGLPNWMQLISALAAIREMYPTYTESDVSGGKGEVEREEIEIPEYIPWEMPEYKPPLPPREQWAAENPPYYESQPDLSTYPGDRYGRYLHLIEGRNAKRIDTYTGNPYHDTTKIRSDYPNALNLYAQGRGLLNLVGEPGWENLSGIERAPDPDVHGAAVYHAWYDAQRAGIDEQLQREYQEELIKSKEDFDRRNEEEERRHREEYDKMVADMLAEQELEASMDTDFSTGDLGQGSGLSPTGELLKMLGDYFNQDTGTDGWNEPAESTPPSWLTVD